jgi:hypothetical protein
LFSISKSENIVLFFEKFQKNPELYWKKYHIEQIYLSAQIKDQFSGQLNGVKVLNITFFLFGRLGFGNQQKLPKDTSIVAFTGKPDPDDVVRGHWPVKKSQFYKKIYKQLKTPKWILENWL